jgi:hypothetical protein
VSPLAADPSRWYDVAVRANPSGRAFPVGSTVCLTVAVAGMAAGSEGIFLRALGTDYALVSFWDGGPLRVPLATLEAVYPLAD